jgi:hypothetical protein
MLFDKTQVFNNSYLPSFTLTNSTLLIYPIHFYLPCLVITSILFVSMITDRIRV